MACNHLFSGSFDFEKKESTYRDGALAALVGTSKDGLVFDIFPVSDS